MPAFPPEGGGGQRWRGGVGVARVWGRVLPQGETREKPPLTKEHTPLSLSVFLFVLLAVLSFSSSPDRFQSSVFLNSLPCSSREPSPDRQPSSRSHSIKHRDGSATSKVSRVSIQDPPSEVQPARQYTHTHNLVWVHSSPLTQSPATAGLPALV